MGERTKFWGGGGEDLNTHLAWDTSKDLLGSYWHQTQRWEVRVALTRGGGAGGIITSLAGDTANDFVGLY